MLRTLTPDVLTDRLIGATGTIDIAVHATLAEVADAWRAFEQVADCTAFQTFAWHDAWQTHIGALQGVAPAIVTGRTDGRLLFIAPLAVERRGFTRVLTWHASDLCDYNAPLLAKDFPRYVPMGRFPRVFEAMLEAVGRTPGRGFDAASLTHMPETVGEQANPFMETSLAPNPSGAHAARLFGTWDTFYTEKRSSATRRRDRTKRKRIGEIGDIAFVIPRFADDVDDTIGILMRQKSAAFARMGVPDLFAKPGHAAFYRAIAADPANRGFVHVSRLEVGGAPAAANLGLVFGGSYYHVLASYGDGPAARFGPGVVHLHELMAYAIGKGCTVFDFTIGDERYKSEWSDVTLVLHDHRCAVTWKGALAMAPAAMAARVKRTVKQTPALWALATRARAAAATLTGRRKTAPAAETEAE